MAAAMDQHRLLGVSRNATDAELKAAYRKLALKHHPDKPGGDAEMFRKVTEAYENLMRNRGHNVHTLFDVWADADDDELANDAEAMRKACLNGNVREALRLLDAGADVNSVDSMGFTALKYACVHGHDMCAEVLISHGAHPDQTSRAGVTALSTPRSKSATRGFCSEPRALPSEPAPAWRDTDAP